MKTTLFIPLTLVAFLLGCETVVDIQIPLEPPKLVINSTLVPGEFMHVHVSQSQHILDESEFKMVGGAIIDIYEDGTLLTTLPDSAGGNYISAIHKPTPGKTYRISVSKNGFENISAGVTVPSDTAHILSVKVDTVELNDFDYMATYLRFSIEIEDDGDIENFYEISVLKEYYRYDFDYSQSPPELLDSTYVIERINLESRDLGLEEFQSYGQRILFDDFLFNGRIYNIRVLTYLNYYNEEYEGKPKYHVVLGNTSESYYLYGLSAKLQYWTEGDPFAQPVQVYNNITNGYGILGAYIQATRSVD